MEWQIYFLMPLILLMWRQLGGLVATGSVAAVVVVSFLAGSYGGGMLPKVLDLTPQFLALFAFGVAGAHVLRASGSWARLDWLGLGLCLLGVMVALLTLLDSEVIEAQFFWIDLLAGAAAAMIFAGLALRPEGRATRALGSRVPRWLGQSSYSLYLIHLPVLGLVYWGAVVRMSGTADERFVVLLLLGLPAAVAASRAFWWCFERPFVENRSWTELRGAWRRT